MSEKKIAVFEEREIAYVTHPVSPELKAKIMAAGYRIVDAQFAPEGAEIHPGDGEGAEAPKPKKQTKAERDAEAKAKKEAEDAEAKRIADEAEAARLAAAAEEAGGDPAVPAFLQH